jgi:hypothetical protein
MSNSGLWFPRNGTQWSSTKNKNTLVLVMIQQQTGSSTWRKTTTTHSRDIVYIYILHNRFLEMLLKFIILPWYTNVTKMRNRKFHKFHIFVTISFKIKFEPNKFRLFITQALYSCVYRYCMNPRFQSYFYFKIERPFPIMAIHISDNKT